MKTESGSERSKPIVIDPGIQEITKKIIGCAIQVGNGLGTGLLEKVNENALVHEMRKQKISFQQPDYRSAS